MDWPRLRASPARRQPPTRIAGSPLRAGVSLENLGQALLTCSTCIFSEVANTITSSDDDFGSQKELEEPVTTLKPCVLHAGQRDKSQCRHADQCPVRQDLPDNRLHHDGGKAQEEGAGADTPQQSRALTALDPERRDVSRLVSLEAEPELSRREFDPPGRKRIQICQISDGNGGSQLALMGDGLRKLALILARRGFANR